MQKLLKVKINIDESNSKICNVNCHYLDTICDECKYLTKHYVVKLIQRYGLDVMNV